MKLTFVETLPTKTKRMPKHKLLNIIREFINSDAKFAKVDFDESDYKKPIYCYKSLYNAIRYWKQGGVSVHLVGGEVYLRKI